MQTAINEVDLSFCKGDLEMIIFENSGCITMVVEYLHGLIDEFVVTKNLNDLILTVEAGNQIYKQKLPLKIK